MNDSFEEYIKILDEKKDVLDIKLLIENLLNAEKVKIGVETSNLLVKFEVIRELLYFNTEEIDDELLLNISKIIIDFTNSDNLWNRFIKYYLSFPSRSPKFFTSLGLALAKANKEDIENILQELKIDKYMNMESKAAINNCFSENNLKNIIKDSTKIVYERWSQYIENNNDYITQVVCTDVIDIVIFYIVNIMEEDEFKAKSKSCVLSIMEINNFWFKCKTDQRSFYYKKLSILFALGFRLEINGRRELMSHLITSTLVEKESLELIEHKWDLVSK